MKVLGLITEYNPFHNGHLYHLNKSIEITGATHTIAVMSGNFLQRGEPALVHKWARAKMAIECGVDLVIELPTAYACSTAELFAYGSISLLHHLNIVDCISFGSEYGEITTLSTIAEILANSPESFKSSLKSYLKMGLPFPVARSKALIDYYKLYNKGCCKEELINISNIMQNPNNILSIEYLKALKCLNSKILPYTISRIKADYHSKDILDNISSATAIREHLKMGKSFEELLKVMPPSSFKILKESYDNGIAPIFKEDFEKAIIAILRREKPQNFSEYFDVNEGLENKIYECSHKCSSIEALYNCIKSKRYTLTRIQRICMHILLNIKKKDLIAYNNLGGPQYARILGFNDKGREIIKQCKLKSKIPIINKINRYGLKDKIVQSQLDLDIRATNIYNLAFKDSSNIVTDYNMSPYYKEDKKGLSNAGYR